MFKVLSFLPKPGKGAFMELNGAEVLAAKPQAVSPELNGAEIVIRCLQAEGVEYVFGYPGGAVLYIYDELFKQDKVKHILVRHEQGAVHASDG